MYKTRLISRLKNLIKKEKATLGVAIKAINGSFEFYHKTDMIFPAASIIKIPVLAEVLRQAQNNVFSLNKKLVLRGKNKVAGAGILNELKPGIKLTIKDLATLMIIISDNIATNMLIDLVGIENINKLMRRHSLKKSILKRKIMIKPKLPTVNFITPGEIAIFLEKLHAGKILNKFYTDLALNILARQQYNEKIPKYLEGVKIAHKTGEINGVRNDAGIILTGRPFILVILSKNSKNKHQTDETIALISKECFNALKLK